MEDRRRKIQIQNAEVWNPKSPKAAFGRPFHFFGFLFDL